MFAWARGAGEGIQTHRLVILGPSELTTDRPAGTALPGLRQTAVIYIDKAVRGELASHMVMDANLGGRRIQGRQRNGVAKRVESYGRCQKMAWYWIIPSTYSKKTFNNEKARFSFCMRHQTHFSAWEELFSMCLSKRYDQKSFAPSQQNAIRDTSGHINISCLWLSLTWGSNKIK